MGVLTARRVIAVLALNGDAISDNSVERRNSAATKVGVRNARASVHDVNVHSLSSGTCPAQVDPVQAPVVHILSLHWNLRNGEDWNIGLCETDACRIRLEHCAQFLF